MIANPRKFESQTNFFYQYQLVHLKDSNATANSVDSEIIYEVIYLPACSKTYIKKNISEVIFCVRETTLKTEKIARAL